MSDHTIKIENGGMTFVYSDELADLLNMGTATVRRVSHVEPHPTKVGWLADMAPVGGPVIGPRGSALPPHRGCDCADCERLVLALEPFTSRAEALAAERSWLTAERGL